MEELLALRPFVPAKDVVVSKDFYQELGFRITLEEGRVSILKCGSFSFLLQDFYMKEVAENLMLQLMVRNADAWWAQVNADKLVERFNVRPPQPPAMQKWGMKVGFLFDPSGVLWHVAESVF